MEFLSGLEQVPGEGIPGAVVTWGIFDGVHLGHQKILRELVRRAKLDGVRSLVITFDRHPEEVLTGRRIPLIVPLKDRLNRIGEIGVDVCLVIPFTKEFARTTAEEFLQEVIRARIKAKAVVLGHDSRFGRDRKGDWALLARIAPELGLAVTRVEADEYRGRPISSSLVRDLIRKGRVREANRLLGKPFELRGKVVHGDHRGKELGFPTANLQTEQDLLPADGVYAGRCLLDGVEYKAVVNLGVRPTFRKGDAPERVIETHILDYEGADFYDRSIQLGLLFRIRDEKRFRSPRSLVQQIKRDIRETRQKA